MEEREPLIILLVGMLLIVVTRQVTSQIKNRTTIASNSFTSDAESSSSLYNGAELNLGDRIFGEVEKASFITLPGKGGHSGLMLSKPHVPTWRR